MTVVIENKEALKSWLTKTLSPICDADPVSLSKYVVALITKKDRNEKELKSICNEQLEVFLQKDTKDFIDKLFRCIKYKGYFFIDFYGFYGSNSLILDYVKRSRSRSRDRSRRNDRRRSGSRDRRRSGSRDRRDRRQRRSRSRDRRSRSRSPRRRSPVDTRRAQSIEKKKEACQDYHEKGYCLAVRDHNYSANLLSTII